MNKYIPENIRAIEEYKPSEGSYQIRLDANESPFNVDYLYLLSKTPLNRYPDPSCGQLVKKFANLYEINSKCVVAGNGSDELISIIVNTFLKEGDSIAVTKPDFSMYSFYASIHGCKVVADEKSGDGGIDFEGFYSAAKSNNVKMVIFSNPCNPTGKAYDRDVILKLVDRLDCLCVVDEAYMEYCREGCSVLKDCEGRENLIVLKTLSKAYGIAGMRIGFAISNEEIAKTLMKIKSPYNVNVVSQLVGYEALKRNPFGIKIDKIRQRTAILYKKLCALQEKGKYTALPTDANFVLLAFENPLNAGVIYRKLQMEGIIIRKPDDFHLRITCGSEAEMSAFMDAFTECVNIDL